MARPSSTSPLNMTSLPWKPTLTVKTGGSHAQGNYRIATLNCGDESLPLPVRANLCYGKNPEREDVKSHHYIISFDPRDAVDNGFDRRPGAGVGREILPEAVSGHQAIVCTHPDGHNHSGNIHVHIVINSLRIEEVPLLPYMDRPADTHPGTNTAAQTRRWNTSKPRSWRCATGKISIKSTCSMAVKTALPSVSIGRSGKGRQSWTGRCCLASRGAASQAHEV